MLFKRHYILESQLAPDDIHRKLNAVTSPAGKQAKFEGVVKTGSFRLLPVYNYSANDRVRSEINGKVAANAGTSRCDIFLDFGLSKEISVLLALGIIVTMVVSLVAVIFPGIFPALVRSFWWVPLPAAAIFTAVIYFTWRARIYEDLRVLEQLLSAKQRIVL